MTSSIHERKAEHQALPGANLKIYLIFRCFLNFWVIWQLLKQFLNKIYYTKNQVLLYLWEIKFTLKRWIILLCNFRGCTYMHTYIIIPCKEMLQGVSLTLLFCQGTLHIMIYVRNWPISTVKNIISYSCIDFFSIHANFHAQNRHLSRFWTSYATEP